MGVGAAAQADDGHPGAFGDQPADLVGHEFEQDGHDAGVFERLGVVDDLLGLHRALALQAEAAEGGDALGREAEVAHDRDAGVDDGLDAGADLGAAFELDAVAGCLGHEAAGVEHGGLVGGLVAHVGHVADEPAVGGAAAHGGGVADHVVHRDRQGGVEAEHGHAEAVANEDDVDAGLLDQVGHGVVVAGDHGEGRALRHLVEERGQGDFFAVGHVGCSYVRDGYGVSCRVSPRPEDLARPDAGDRDASKMAVPQKSLPSIVTLRVSGLAP